MAVLPEILETEWKYADSESEFVREVVIWLRENTKSEGEFQYRVVRVNRYLSNHSSLSEIPVDYLTRYCFECWAEKLYNSETEELECIRCED